MDTLINRDETFGPIVPLLTVDGDDHALDGDALLNAFLLQGAGLLLREHECQQRQPRCHLVVLDSHR